VTESLDGWNLALLALGSVLLVEGLLPCLSPPRWRAAVEKAAQLSDGQLRFMGLLAVVAGAVILTFFAR
jgi:uncharacterized protein